MASISSTSGATSATVIRNSEQDVATGAALLQKINQADRNLVATLLPPPPPPNAGRVNLAA